MFLPKKTKNMSCCLLIMLLGITLPLAITAASQLTEFMQSAATHANTNQALVLDGLSLSMARDGSK